MTLAMDQENDKNYPTGATVPFPYESPYPQQVALMEALLQGIRSSTGSPSRRLVCLESPTGTGKSLSLACASLAWLEYMESRPSQEDMNDMPQPGTAQDKVGGKSCTTNSTATVSPPSSTTSSKTGLSWLDEWQPEHDQVAQEQERIRQQRFRDEERRRQEQLLQTLESIRQEGPDTERRENLARQAITRAKVAARKRQRQQQQQQQKRTIPLEYESDPEEDIANNSSTQRKFKKPDLGTPEWLLQEPPQQHQIIYAARTHSQLSQFISEVRKTKWGNTCRVVALGSRSQGLCGYLSHKKLSEQAMTEQCLELRQSKKRASPSGSTCACPYYQPSAVATLALHSLATPTDLEDMIQLGKVTQTCAYYATRQAIAQAQLIVVPYTVLIDHQTRQAVGINLQHSLVLIDEAHNLPQAIQSVVSAKVSIEICRAASQQLDRYTNKYLIQQDRLNALHSQLLGHLKAILKAMEKSMKTSSKSLCSIPQYLCSYKLDSINLFPLLRYLQESRLSQKLLGFMKDTNEEQTKNTTAATSAVASDKDTTSSTSSSSTPLSSHISPMSIVESFLTKMNSFDPKHAKVVAGENMLELVVLNPAVHAQDDLYQLPHAVCLVGGTLQPLPVLVQELVPSLTQEAKHAQALIQGNHSASGMAAKSSIVYQSPSFVGFSCGHVVSPDHVLLQSLTRVGSTTMDLRHKTRSLPVMLQAIGQGIIELCQEVPHGVVVFVPSYSYEQVLVQAWKTTKIGKQGDDSTTIWEALSRIKPIFREPKQRTEMDQALQDYAKKAESSVRGALLLAVVGGKLSEGINFANRLCRCVVVVGLPYADKSDPILQEKMKFLDSNYYQALCLRAVNQSVGRAIRHAKDYAAIVLMDVRYPSDSGIANGLPQWLTSSNPKWRQQTGTLDSVVKQLRLFFQNPKFQEDIE